MSGSTLWVSPLGSDSNSGTEDSPLASINHAISLAEPGTQILVKAGTYTENVTVSPGVNYQLSQLTEENNLEIISVDGPGAAIIESADSSQREPTVFIVDVSHVVIDGFEIVSDVTSGDAGAVKIIGRNQGVEDSVEQSTDITLQNNTFSGYGEFMVKGAMVEGVKIYNNQFEGDAHENLIDFTTVWNSEIVGNDFSGTAWYGVSMKTGSQYILVADNYFDFGPSPAYGGKTAILVGGVGYSDLDRPPLPEEFSDHEADYITITGNVIVSDTKSSINFQGGNNSLVEGNLLGATGGIGIHSTTSPSPQTGGSSGNNTIIDNILMNVTTLNSYYTDADIEGTVFANNVEGDLSDVTWLYGTNATVDVNDGTQTDGTVTEPDPIVPEEDTSTAPDPIVPEEDTSIEPETDPVPESGDEPVDPVAPTEPESGGDGGVLIVHAAGSGTPNRTASFEVFADGVSLGTATIDNPMNPKRLDDWEYIRNADKYFQDFAFDFEGATPTDVEIVFNSDRGPGSGVDVNLAIDYIELEGQRFESEEDGYFESANGDLPFLEGPREIMYINGSIHFDDLSVM